MSIPYGPPRELAGAPQALVGALLSALDHLGEAFALVEEERIIYANEAYYAMTGYTREEVAAPSFGWIQTVAPDDRSTVLDRHRRRRAGEAVENRFESALLHRSGRRIDVEASVTPFELTGGVLRLAVLLRNITDRKRMEESLYESEERFRTLAESMTAAVFLHGDGRLLYVNPAAETLTGYTRDELLPLDPLTVIDPADRPVPAVDAPEAAGPAEFRGELRIRTKDGERRWIDVSGATRVLGNRPVTVGTALDITDRKRHEDLLRNIAQGVSATVGERFFESIVWYLARALEVEYALVGELTSEDARTVRATAIVDHGRIVEPFTYALAGTPCEQVIGGTLCCYPSGAQALFPSDRLLADLGVEGYVGTPLFGSDGRTLGLLVVMTERPLRDPATARTMLQIFAARTSAELERTRAEAALRRSERQHRSLVRGAVHGMYRSSVDGKFLEVNPALVRMLGYDSEAELLGMDLATDVYADPTERERLIGGVRADDALEAESETRWKRRDGSIITVRLSGRPITNDRGGIEGFEMIAEDVTERRAFEEQVRYSQKMEAVGRLAGGIAHDFNNLLTVIGGYTELQLVGLPAGDPRRHDLEQVLAAARRAAGLTRQLLAFGRKQVRQVQRLDLNALVANLDQILRRLVGNDIAVEIRRSGLPAPIDADASQIEQGIINLAANARDAMPDGGRLTLAVRLLDVETTGPRPGSLAAGRYVELLVGDTGRGMDAETRARLFDPFFTTKEVGHGSGLGLSTVYGVVAQNGGEIRVDTRPGHGTTFRLYFPRGEPALEGDRPVETGKVPALSGTETILLVEDETSVRSLVRQMLERQGYTVLEAGSSAEALAQADGHSGFIHLLLTDVVMPGMHGPALASVLLERRPRTQVLLMSGYSERLSDGSAPWALIHKPFTTDALARKIRETLDQPAQPE